MESVSGNTYAYEVLRQRIIKLHFETMIDGPTTDEVEAHVNIDIAARTFAQKHHEYEVTLKVDFQGFLNQVQVFKGELDYGAHIKCTAYEDIERKAIILVTMPTLLFPYCRRIISEVTQNAGFSPLYLEPIDFDALYHGQVQSEDDGLEWKYVIDHHEKFAKEQEQKKAPEA